MNHKVRSSVIVIENGRLLTRLAIDPTSGRECLCLPGGEVGEDETAPHVAVRETFAETGYHVDVNPTQNTDREKYDGLTIFYRGSLQHATRPTLREANESSNVHWIPLDDLAQFFAPETVSAIQELA